MSHTEADDADAKPSQPFELGGGDQISVSVEPQPPKSVRAQNTDDRTTPGIVNPPDGLAAQFGARRRSKSLQSGPLLTHVVDELDPRVGSQLLKVIVVDGIVGVEDYSVAPVCIIEA
jgi:hypothetical protein